MTSSKSACAIEQDPVEGRKERREGENEKEKKTRAGRRKAVKWVIKYTGSVSTHCLLTTIG